MENQVTHHVIQGLSVSELLFSVQGKVSAKYWSIRKHSPVMSSSVTSEYSGPPTDPAGTSKFAI